MLLTPPFIHLLQKLKVAHRLRVELQILPEHPPV